MQEETWSFKIIIVGDPAVGKTSLLVRSIENKFEEEYLSTIGVDFYIKDINIENEAIKMQIWDTGGEEKYSSVRPSYYMNAVGAIIVYDVTKPSTFRSIPRWMSEVQKFCPSIPMIIAENKIDLPREIPENQVNKQIHQLNIPYFQTSAKDDINVEKMFKYFAEMIMKLKIIPSKPDILSTLSLDEISANYARCSEYARNCILEKRFQRALNALEKAFIYSNEIGYQEGIDWVQETIVFLTRMMYGDSSNLIMQKDEKTGIVNPIIRINGLKQKLIMPPQPAVKSEPSKIVKVPKEVFDILKLIRDKIVFGVSLENLISQMKKAKESITTLYQPHEVVYDMDDIIKKLDNFDDRIKAKPINQDIWNMVYAKVHEWKVKLNQE
ncbi:MAG: GTP-binding protein [Candidatus Lokiarchaeota archaeon]|nr:GTP-binding protein [Candidatus Lokiarchaeota archaeon]